MFQCLTVNLFLCKLALDLTKEEHRGELKCLV